MLGKTLALYFGLHFTKLVLAIFFASMLLIALVTYLEFANRAFVGDARFNQQLAMLALLRVPAAVEDALPFIVLYGSIAAFVIANRRLETVVARAAGVSAWQFLLPACFVGLLIGVIGTAVYNPFAARMQSWSDGLGSEVFYNHETTSAPTGDRLGPMWLRQAHAGTQSIIGSTDSFDGGLGLAGVTVYLFDGEGRFVERIDSPRGRYTPGEWRFERATVTSSSRHPRAVETYILPTDLTEDEVKRTFLRVNSVSFWTLRELAASARRAGVPSRRYELQYNMLLSRPVLLLAMVLIAAIVSARFSRSKNAGRMIIAGVSVGFMLYVVMKIAWDLGSGGVVPPPLAAWLPAIIATLVGLTVLLHLEDG
ncbi:MAG: LptF/LptG family permease [Alphaproteobacteria bacterium]